MHILPVAGRYLHVFKNIAQAGYFNIFRGHFIDLNL